MGLSHLSLLSEARPGALSFGNARVALVDVEAGFWGLRRQMEALVGRRLADTALQQAGARGGASFARAFVGQPPQAEAAEVLRHCVAAYQAAGFGRLEVDTLDWAATRVVIRAADTFESWMVRQHGQSADSPVCAYTAGVLVGFVSALVGRQDVVCVERACQAQGADACVFELLPADQADGGATVSFDSDPLLTHQLSLLDVLFDRMPMGIAVLDRNLVLRRCNPTWAGFIERYTHTPASRVVPGVRFGDLAPGTDSTSIRRYQRALAGETVREEVVRMECAGIVSYWDVVITPLVQDGEVVGVVDVTTDANERALGQQTLEQRVRDRTRELSTLLEVSHNVASTLELEPLLDVILAQLKVVVDYKGATIHALEGDVLRPLAYRGPVPTSEALQWRFPLKTRQVSREVIAGRTPVIIPDVRADLPLARAFRESAGDLLDTTFRYVRSWLGVPLVARDRAIGMLSLDHDEPSHYTRQQADLALAFANQVAVAIENARLYQEEQDRRQEAEQRRLVAESLRDVLAILNSNRPLGEILGYIVSQACRLLGTDSGAIYRLEPDGKLLTIQSACGLPSDHATTMPIPFGQGTLGRAVEARRPVTVADLRTFTSTENTSLEAPVREHLGGLASHFRALLAVPVAVKDELYGGIVLYYPWTREFSPDDVELAVAIADQAALAIENARLRARAEQSAAAAERSRLARDLHDAVTQTLFSASLIAEVLPRLWERNSDEGRRRLAELRELTRGALAEMRTLLLELRPAALTENSLGDLLRHLADATTGRARLPVRLAVEGQRPLPPDVQIALYRIAQEALNNVARHSGASEASVTLRYEPKWVELHVVDNGHGFDPAGVPPDHLGQGIMRERAQSIGATLTVQSQVGHGTQVTVVWHGKGSGGSRDR